MIDINELNDTFGIKGELSFEQPDNNLIFLIVSNKFANAKICLYGAHIMSFRPRNSVEILWMSPKSNFQVGEPIRGGIPVCFPWFGPHTTDPLKPQHGFGRLMYWDISGTSVKSTGETFIRLKLNASPETHAFWPYDFCAVMTVIIGKTLDVSLNVTNQSPQSFEYTCALHSYYNLSSIDNIAITGLQGARYHSQLEPGNFIQETPTIEIRKAETRHYHNTEASCVIGDTMFKRKIRISKAGSKITTVWNPGAETCAKIGDLPDDAYKTFVCVEAVNAFDDVISLAPNESHSTSAMIGLEE
jgi:glucose-6-phosphate 1-epimerase